MPRGDGTGPYGGQGRGTGQGRGGQGMGGGSGLGPGGQCRCTNCGYVQQHQLGVPCYNQKCPKCGAPMTRA